MQYIVLSGRILYSLVFVVASVGHFTKESIEYVAAQGIPLAWLTVPLFGVIALVGGLSVALGYKAKWGAWFLIWFLAPVTVLMLPFWAVRDPVMEQVQQISFMKNLSMLGGALLISYFGSGPLSLDDRKRANAADDEEALAA